MAADQNIHKRPTRELLLQLPLLPITPDQRIDYEAADPALLVELAENAETVMNTINLGLSAVGTILAHASPEVGSEISSSTIESLGWCIAEMSDIAATLLSLACACRHYTVDYTALKPKRVPIATF
jgi:hypothetical protein